MAIATLDKCYANSNVFTGVVKIRKGMSCKLILRTNNLEEVHETFYIFAQSIMSKAQNQRNTNVLDPSYERTIKACKTICNLTEKAYSRQHHARRLPVYASGLLLAGSCYMAFGTAASSERSALSTDKMSLWKATLAGAAILVYSFGFDSLRGGSSLKTANDLEKKNV